MVKWIYKNKKILLFIGGVSMLIPLSYITYLIITSKADSTPVSININTIPEFIVLVYYILMIFLLLSFGLYWIVRQMRLLINLKNEKAKTELKHLKAQVSPHFFFNMLNNLYGLIDVNPDKAKQLILKLSDMMRYSIYDGQSEEVILQDEIDFISNYIELHKMRYQKSIKITFISDVKSNNIKVTPLLFIILVENAFKHGVEVLRKDAFININLKADIDKVLFRVENNFDEEIKTEIGIGLKNLKRRLELIYGKKYRYSTQISNGIYKTALEIQL